MESERYWAGDLQADIAHAILDKLVEPRDHANFGAVCKDWHSLGKDYIRKQPLLPMLMVPTLLGVDEDGKGEYSRTEISLYSISTGKIYDVWGTLSVPDKMRYCGSSHGWLATVEEKTVIVLVNPFRDGLTIRLPPLDFREWLYNDEYNIYKVILSADPLSNPDSYIAVAIYSVWRRLAFYKSSQNCWGYIDRSIIHIDDAIIYKGLVYAVIQFGNDIISFDVNSSSEPWELKRFKSRKPRPEKVCELHYLVVSSEGEILQVHRCLEFDRIRATESFEVFKLQLVQEKGEDEGIVEKAEVKSLGNDAIFLGQNYSFVVPIDTPCSRKFRLCQPNSIYYTTEFLTALHLYDKYKDVGSFNFEDKTFRRFYKYHPCQEWNKQMSRPLWITPLLL
ncbi:hypothetical protein PTKIN_Ptkin17bG0119000 [Pterospermum kingtungense]